MSPRDLDLAELFLPVSAEMDAMRDVLVEQLDDASGSVRDMTGHVSRFRGKQLRAALVLLSAKACGTYTPEHPSVAAVVEMIHLATLVHDDILDGAEVRRRVACVNQRWDNQIAVLLGDFLYARAFALSTTLSSRLCSRLLAETTRVLCVGEIEQSARRYDFEVERETLERIASSKTASLYSAACELGARYPGGETEKGETMAAFGREVGLAFQLVDDCLDLVGDEAVLGKSVGSDVQDGKVTLPVWHVYRGADPTTRARIRDAYTLPNVHDRAAALKRVVDVRPGVEATMVDARGLLDGARDRLRGLPESAARSSLEEITRFVLKRSF
ncbi:MAG: polyprenyl synthetase family protein [Planctomycetota bacterium]